MQGQVADEYVKRDEDKRAPSKTQSFEESEPEARDMDGEDESGGTGTAMALEEGKMGKKDSDRAEGQYKMRAAAADQARNAGILGGAAATVPVMAPPADAPGPGRGGGDDGKNAETVTRAWFPETFLFEPLVVTDAAGKAEVRVRVPDRLTSWRVLALAHSRSGAQGGAIARFLGTLPTYVDLVVPDTLVNGDEVRLPIQIVNTTESAVTTSLELTATNATVSGGGGDPHHPGAGQPGRVRAAEGRSHRRDHAEGGAARRRRGGAHDRGRAGGQAGIHHAQPARWRRRAR